MKYIAIFSLATAALALPAPNVLDAAKVRLARRRAVTRSTGEVDPEVYLGQLQYTLQKYGKQITLVSGLKDHIKRTGSTGNEALNDQGADELYYGNAQVGTQTFTVDFDTGSSDFFVPGPQCTAANGCSGTTKYNQGGTDEGNKTSVTYGSGSVSGENYYDSATVAGLTATHQNIVSLTTATGFSGSDAEGLVGMAFQSIANSKQPPFFQTLMSEGQVAQNEFAFYLGRQASGTGANSELTLGGVDTSKYTGALTQVPLTAQTYWQVGLDRVLVNGNSPLIDTTKGNAAIDTGTTIILAPTVAAAAIYSLIPGSFPVPLVAGVGPTIFAYPCSGKPTVSIQFAGKQFAIAPEDFNFGTLTSAFGSLLGNSSLESILSGGNYCLGAIAADDIDPTVELYVVGDTFLKSWYAVFSFDNHGGQPSVSFAKSV